MEERVVHVKSYDQESRFYNIDSDNLKYFYIDGDEDNDSDDNKCLGFYSPNGLLLEYNKEIFEVLTIQVGDCETDFYGTGIDRYSAVIEGEQVYLARSRWQGSLGYYYFEEY